MVLLLNKKLNMPLIANSEYIDAISGWSIKIIDKGTSGKNKFNPNKLNFDKIHRVCQHNICSNVIRINNTSGFCENHETHLHDLLLELHNPSHRRIDIPSHVDIINQLVNWSK